MKSFTILVVLWLFVINSCGEGKKQKKPVLRGNLFKNSKFKPIEDFSDEFKGSFNHRKWYNSNPRWLGRQPGLFSAKNVKQRRGKLLLKGRYEKDDKAFKDAPEGYEKYTTSFVMSKKNALYGYFEVSAKPSNSRLSSSFWGSLDTPTLWTEIDVFELGGGAQNQGIDYRRRINMNMHVFRHQKKGITPGVNEISKPYYYIHNAFLRSKFHVYGLDWGKKHITWTFNGRAIRRERNTLWKQAFPMKFDVETMPYWFGLPSKRTLPATYKVRYIRAWSRKRRKNSQDTVRTASRNSLPTSARQTLAQMFGGAAPAGVLQGDDDDGTDDDDAELQVHEPVPETNAPRDGLQRPPIPGSNERVYAPVVPVLGGSWGPVIEKQNALMDDVFDAQFAPGEIINPADFDGELTWFGQPAATPKPGRSAPAPAPAPAPARAPATGPAPAPAPATAPAPAPEGASGQRKHPLKTKGLFGGVSVSFPWG